MKLKMHLDRYKPFTREWAVFSLINLTNIAVLMYLIDFQTNLDFSNAFLLVFLIAITNTLLGGGHLFSSRNNQLTLNHLFVGCGLIAGGILLVYFNLIPIGLCVYMLMLLLRFVYKF